MDTIFVTDANGNTATVARWGSAAAARKQFSRAGGQKDRARLVRFWSNLPFAKIIDRNLARPDEADAYVNGNGSITYVRCLCSLRDDEREVPTF